MSNELPRCRVKSLSFDTAKVRQFFLTKVDLGEKSVVHREAARQVEQCSCCRAVGGQCARVVAQVAVSRQLVADFTVGIHHESSALVAPP